MSSKKKNKKEETKMHNSTEHVVEFNFPKNKEIGSKDARLNELLAQSYLRDIINLKD